MHNARSGKEAEAVNIVFEESGVDRIHRYLRWMGERTVSEGFRSSLIARGDEKPLMLSYLFLEPLTHTHSGQEG